MPFRAYSLIFNISIHALRVEGDAPAPFADVSFIHFYPRPPCGGRPDAVRQPINFL